MKLKKGNGNLEAWACEVCWLWIGENAGLWSNGELGCVCKGERDGGWGECWIFGWWVNDIGRWQGEDWELAIFDRGRFKVFGKFVLEDTFKLLVIVKLFEMFRGFCRFKFVCRLDGRERLPGAR